MTDLKKLREFAENATPGPWSWRKIYWTLRCARKQNIINDGDWPDLEPRLVDETNAEFIAAANPTTVLALLDTIERYEKALGHIASGRFGCDECTDPSTLLADHHTCIAREALNPKEGV